MFYLNGLHISDDNRRFHAISNHQDVSEKQRTNNQVGQEQIITNNTHMGMT